MSHKNRNNYNNYSKMSAANASEESVVNKAELAPIVESEVVEEEPSVMTGPVVVEDPEPHMKDPNTPAPEKPIKGIVSGCSKLNVRANPSRNANIIDIVPTGCTLSIIGSKSTAEWYCIIDVFGKEAYCMKKFVTLKK